MKFFTSILTFLVLLGWSGVASGQIIAQQDFNSLAAGTFTTDQLPSGTQLTNSGSRNIGGPGLDFASTWFDTRGVFFGPVTPSGDASDFIGVNSFAGSSAPDVAADGTPVAAGVEQNFEFNDTDGAVVLSFEAVDVSGFTNRQLRLNYWINDTGYESDDAFTISLSNGGLGIVLLGFGETELEANAEIGEANPASWKTLTVDLDAVLASSGLNPANLILAIAVDVNSGDENIFIDDVVFESVSIAPCNISSLTAHFLPCRDNNTSAGDDDTFISDYTIQFTNPPTTGDIELIVRGQTYSTSVAGLGAQFQFLSIPLQADGQPVVATVRFTADPSCTLTATVGTAPLPCSVVDPCTELFISEYIEGSGLNKCIEIYNPTSTPIDLSAYDIFLSFNGGSFENNIPLTGVVGAGDVYVVCNSGAAADFLNQADQITGDLNFNGNDAVLLRDAVGTIDAIGQQGNASTYGANVTLRRKHTVQAGDNNPFDAFNLSEWDSYPSNTFWGLGYHVTACQPALPLPWNPFVIGCQDGSVDENAGTWTLTSACFNPSPGQDDLTMAFQELCGDGEIIARVSNVGFAGWGGVMFRENMAPGSKYTWLFATGSNWGRFGYRATTNGSVAIQQFPNFGKPWLRLTRTGNLFRSYVSFNGVSWQLRGQAFVPMNQCLFVGLALHSNVDGNSVAAMFDNVRVNAGTPLDVDAPESDLTADRLQPAPGAQLRLYPNPARQFLDITTTEWVDETTVVTIFDANGQRLFTDRFDRYGQTLRLDLEALGLPAGLYLLHVTNGEAVLSERFIKQ